jgi:cytochrome P450 family 135
MGGTQPEALRGLPRAPLHDVVRHGIKLLRPGAGTSPLSRLGERFVVTAPLSPPTLVTTSIPDIRELFTDPFEDFSFGAVLRRFSSLETRLGSDALLFLDGESHRVERKQLVPSFMGPALKSYEGLIADAVHSRVDQWPVGEPLSFVTVADRLLLDVMISIVFGVTEPNRIARLEEALHRWLAAGQSAAFRGLTMIGIVTGGHTFGYPPLKRAAAALDDICLEEIAERRERGVASAGVIDGLLASNNSRTDPKDDLALARVLRGAILGYETTATTLAWVAELVSHHHEVLEELERSLDDDDESYLEAVIRETLRYRPPVPVSVRRAVRDTELNGTHIPKRATVMVPTLALHERSDIYEQPEQFRPERFLGSRPGTYEFLTFGAGAHRCLGDRLAIAEVKVLIRTVMHHRRFTALPGPASGPGLRPTMLVPANGARIVLDYR